MPYHISRRDQKKERKKKKNEEEEEEEEEEEKKKEERRRKEKVRGRGQVKTSIAAEWMGRLLRPPRDASHTCRGDADGEAALGDAAGNARRWHCGALRERSQCAPV